MFVWFHSFSFLRFFLSLSLFKPSTVSYPDNKTKKIAKENKYRISEQNPEVYHHAFFNINIYVCMRTFFFRRGKALAFLQRQKNGEMDLGVCAFCVLLVRSFVCLCMVFFSWRFSLLHLNI